MIAGAGFAMMAWRLAQMRAYGHVRSYAYPPFPRYLCVPGRKPASTEYYRIIDEATRRFIANGAWHNCGLYTSL